VEYSKVNYKKRETHSTYERDISKPYERICATFTRLHNYPHSEISQLYQKYQLKPQVDEEVALVLLSHTCA